MYQQPGAYGASRPLNAPLRVGQSVPANAAFVGGQAVPVRSVASTPYGVPYGAVPVKDTPAFPMDKKTFMIFGVVLLLWLCALPFADALCLLQDFNYTYWAGTDLAVTMIITFVILVLAFIAMAEVIFTRWHPVNITTQNIVMFTSVYVCMMGLFLVLVSMPLSARSLGTYNSIMYQCEFSRDTRELHSYYLAMLKLRLTDDCQKHQTVEDCVGYGNIDSRSMSEYLRSMEEDFRCTGFCRDDRAGEAKRIWHGAVLAQDGAPTKETKTVTNRTSGVLLELREIPVYSTVRSALPCVPAEAAGRKLAFLQEIPVGPPCEPVEQIQVEAALGGGAHGEGELNEQAQTGASSNVQEAQTLAASADNFADASSATGAGMDDPGNEIATGSQDSAGSVESLSSVQVIRAYPPALFSTAKYKASCEGAAARDLYNTGRDIAAHTWYLGIALIFFSVIAGVWEWAVLATK